MATPKPCRRCGGHKEPGRRRWFCDACVPLSKGEAVLKNRERTRRDYSRNPATRAAVAAAATARRLADPMLATAGVTTSILRGRGTTIVDPLVVPLIVLERHDGVCGICHEDVDPFAFQVDHIIPLSLGGEHSYANTQPSHPSCNRSKGANLQEVHA